MEEQPSWEQKLHALTHVLTDPTTAPSLHSQLFISTQVPCFLDWDYPPILCSSPRGSLTKWAFLRFLRRAGLPKTSWRSKCPYHLPPPLVLAKGVEEARWGEEEKRTYVWRRLRRKRLGSDVNPLLPIVVPNLLLLSLLFWNPISLDDA